MRRIFCWLFGHQIMAAGPRSRVCIRCNQHEQKRMFGQVVAWELVPAPAPRDSR
jgi:hypothetical protein